LPVMNTGLFTARAYPIERDPSASGLKPHSRASTTTCASMANSLPAARALTVDVLKDGWGARPDPAGLLVREARPTANLSLSCRCRRQSGQANSPRSFPIRAGRPCCCIAFPVAPQLAKKVSLASTARRTRASVQLPRQGVDVRLTAASALRNPNPRRKASGLAYGRGNEALTLLLGAGRPRPPRTQPLANARIADATPGPAKNSTSINTEVNWR